MRNKPKKSPQIARPRSVLTGRANKTVLGPKAQDNRKRLVSLFIGAAVAILVLTYLHAHDVSRVLPRVAYVIGIIGVFIGTGAALLFSAQVKKLEQSHTKRRTGDFSDRPILAPQKMNDSESRQRAYIIQ